MNKRSVLLLAATVVLALAAPSFANAAEATCPAGTRCPVGTQVTFTGKNVTLTINTLGTKKCGTLSFNATLVANAGNSVETKGETTNPTQTECKGGSSPVTVTNFNIVKLLASDPGTGPTKTGTMSFTTAIDTPELKCLYTGTNVPFTYTYQTDTIKFNNAAGITGSPSICGTAKLDAEFTLEKKGTTSPIILD